MGCEIWKLLLRLKIQPEKTKIVYIKGAFVFYMKLQQETMGVQDERPHVKFEGAMIFSVFLKYIYIYIYIYI